MGPASDELEISLASARRGSPESQPVQIESKQVLVMDKRGLLMHRERLSGPLHRPRTIIDAVGD